MSRGSSKAASRDVSRPPSAIDNHIDYFREPVSRTSLGEVGVGSTRHLAGEVTVAQVVKSPPEPTRVKSPEQLLMRSPDPINWTVPLDTRNTFSVTQSVRDSGESVFSPLGSTSGT